MGQTKSPIARLLVALALLLVAGGFWVLQTYGAAKPVVLSIAAPLTAFSAARAEQTLARLLGPERPHPVSTDENVRVRGRIISELSALNLRPLVFHGFACRSPDNYGVLICASVNDVIAEVKSGQGKAIVLLAHYDSVPAGPGAADDESGVATVIETARALIAEGLSGKHPIMALLTDGEEADLLGAAAFLRQPKWRARVGAVVNVEARGNRGPSLLFQTSAGDQPLIDIYAKNVPEYATSSLYHEIYRFLPNDTDLTLFIADGFPSYNFAFVGGIADYHTAKDVRANLDLASLQQHGDNMLGVVKGLENTDFTRLRGSDDVYFDILGRWLPRLPSTFAVPLALLAFLGTLAAALLTPDRYGWRDWLRGFAVMPALILLALFNGFLLHAIASLISGMPDPAYAYPAAFRIALTFALGGSALLVSRWAAWVPSTLATWLLLSGMGIAVAIFLPGLSLYFLLPSVAASVALIISARTRRNLFRVGAALFAALVALLVWSSIGTLGEMLMGLKLHPLFTIPFAIALATLVPALSVCAPPRPVWFAGVTGCFGLSIAAAAVQGFEPTFSAAAPQRLSITYVQDRARSQWAVDAFAPVPKSMRAVVPFSARPQRISDIAALSYIAPAASMPLPAPTATVIAHPSSGGLRRVTINLHGSHSTAQMYVTIPRAAGLRSIEIGGWHTDLPAAWAGREAVAIACMSSDCAEQSITLALASRLAVNLGIYEHRFGLPDFAHALVAARPPTAVPSQNGDGMTLASTVALPAAQ